MFTLPCDENGELCGTIINDNYYYYIKNIFGDILGLVDENGGYVADYTYDAWGNILSATASIDNSLRYKGYYYDSETDMYYCHTRYYVPKWLRWLNSDNVEYLDTDDFAGINLFVYCGNNPVIAADPDGKNWKSWAIAGLIILAGVALAIVTVGVGAAVLGASMATIASIATATAVGGTIAGGVNLAVQASSVGIDNIDRSGLLLSTYVGGVASGVSAGFGSLSTGSGTLASVVAQRSFQTAANIGINLTGYYISSMISGKSPDAEGMAFAIGSAVISSRFFNSSTLTGVGIGLGIEIAGSWKDIRDIIRKRFE